MEKVAERIYGETRSGSPAAQSAQPSRDLSKISRSVASLSELYTRRRPELHGKLLQDDDLRAAYLSYFLPLNLCKNRQILKEIWLNSKSRPLFSSSLRVLDLGCGPGSMLLGFLDFLVDLPRLEGHLNFCAIDLLRENLDDARFFAEWWVSQFFAGPDKTFRERDITLHFFRADMRHPLSLPDQELFHFILIGNVMNELFRGEIHRIESRYEIISRLVKRWLVPEGFLILLEPALKETSRDLLLLRNELVRQDGLNVYSPCLHNNPCPAVSAGNPNDWCHEDRPWHLPRVLRNSNQRLFKTVDAIKYSYVVLTRQNITVADSAIPNSSGVENLPSKDLQLWRVVSEAIEEHGRSCAFLCGISGREKTTLLNKHKSSSNCAFKKLRRGQVIATHRLIDSKPKDWRVGPDTEVRILLNPQ
jgi:ribosomal protein RSM22 (predicted rRNA methylase)